MIPPVIHAQEQTTVLTMGSWRVDDIVQMYNFLDYFHLKFPHIRIRFDPTTPPQYDQVLSAQLQGGTAPDLMYLRSYSTSRKLYDSGFLEPLDNMPGLRTSFQASHLQPWQGDDGSVYGVPFIAVSHGIYYNKDLFHHLNVSVPDTWEELLLVARTFAESGVIPFANASGDAWTINEIVMMNILPNFIGGREGRLAYLTGERCLNDQNMINAFQALADLSPFFPKNHALLKYTDSLSLFFRGQAAMWMGGSWDIILFEHEQLPFSWDIFAPPSPEGESPTVVFHPDAGMGLNAASEHKEAAMVFLSWLTSPEAGKLMADLLPGFFPMHSVRPDLNNVHMQSFLDLSADREEDIRFVWDKLRDGEPDGYYLLEHLSLKVLNGRLTPRQAADALQSGLSQWFVPSQTCAH
ncbi:ABC transporter substrate-binding protein [Desulfobulbus alkaliphilus]|uniref:ABC transporter substrate-binding protein n=1 Tax=Desulfobulbus alkaliphilus TaxID=869814 RepID=UPI00196643BC|nr:extracellular solute-binding protein [Desulfobulbus alkaliphilus]MBM9537528.1 extracellular solute-binding protein [Desulfobulbus alkaliphilus]